MSVKPTLTTSWMLRSKPRASAAESEALTFDHADGIESLAKHVDELLGGGVEQFASGFEGFDVIGTGGVERGVALGRVHESGRGIVGTEDGEGVRIEGDGLDAGVLGVGHLASGAEQGLMSLVDAVEIADHDD